MTDEELIEIVGRAIEAADSIDRNVLARAAIAAMQARFKAERIRGGEMVKEAAAIAAKGTWAEERIRALSVPAIVEAGEHQPKENSDASSD